jgi:hypothetical protein
MEKNMLGKRDKPEVYPTLKEEPLFFYRNGKRYRVKKPKPDYKPEDVYFFVNDLRCVKPYPHTFGTFCKRRWIGQKLVEVY